MTTTPRLRIRALVLVAVTAVAAAAFSANAAADIPAPTADEVRDYLHEHGEVNLVAWDDRGPLSAASSAEGDDLLPDVPLTAAGSDPATVRVEPLNVADGVATLHVDDAEADVDEVVAWAHNLVEAGAATEVTLDPVLRPVDDTPQELHDGLTDARIPEQWEVTQAAGATIAVVDTGVTPNDALPEERVLDGVSVIDEDPHDDDSGHGTSVAVIAAGQDPAPGACPTCDILPVQVLSTVNSGLESNVIEGVEWAADNGADVINISLGGPHVTSRFEQTLNDVSDDVLVVAAAGNEGTEDEFYPAALSSTVAVGGNEVGTPDRRHPDSNYGPWVDVAATFVNPSLDENGDAVLFAGTSGATPLVAGVAGALLPGDPDPGDVAEALRTTADDVSWVQYGPVDAHAAADALAGHVTVTVIDAAGDPLADTDVTVTRDGASADGTTDTDGVAHVGPLVAGDATVTVAPPDGEVITDDVTIPAGSAVDHEVVSYGDLGELPRHRVAGGNRFETAAAVADTVNDERDVTTALLATGYNHPDALAAAPLAAEEDGVLLLVDGATLPDATADALADLDVDHVVALGGATVVPDEALEAAAAQADASTTRLAGEDRYETAAEVTDELTTETHDEVWLVNGERFPDALSASAPAARHGTPIVLTRADELPGPSLSLLEELSPDMIHVAGGTSAVSDDVERAAADAADADTVRYAGSDRYDTSQKISRDWFGSGSVAAATLTTGRDFPDALTGSVLAAATDSPLLLADSDDDALTSELARLMEAGAATVHGLGGTSALPDDVLAAGT